jgi:hypothetical protein
MLLRWRHWTVVQPPHTISLLAMGQQWSRGRVAPEMMR